MFKKKRQRSTKGRTTRRPMLYGRKKRCKFCLDKVEDIDYKDISRLERFTTERGKILPSRISGNCARHQRVLTRAIKRARVIALMPYIAGY